MNVKESPAHSRHDLNIILSWRKDRKNKTSINV